MAKKAKTVQRKISDGPINPQNQNPNDAFGNFSPQWPALPDIQVVPAPPAAVRPVVDPPAPGPVAPLVP